MNHIWSFGRSTVVTNRCCLLLLITEMLESMSTRSSKPSQTTSAALNQLIRIHDEGKAFWRNRRPRSIDQAASEFSKVKERKIRHFADSDTGYSDSDLKTLIEQCTQADFPMRFSHIIRLLSIAKKDRKSIQDEIVENKMSKSDLDRYLYSVFGRKRQGVGRKPLVLRSKKTALEGLLVQCEKWERIRSYLRDQKNGAAKKLPDTILSQLEAASISVSKLQGLLERALTSTKKPSRTGK